MDPKKSEYTNTIDRLEPGIVPIDHAGAIASIAISLKRIADTLEQANINEDILANSIEGAIYRGLTSAK